jgi:hypothetical protein
MRLPIAACAALLMLAPAALAQPQQQQRPTCVAAEHRALDFWVGEWDAYRADTNAPAGRSSIRREDDGCVITEHWTSIATPYSGRSLNIYDRASGRWEQYWVDSTGARTLFIGGPIENGMQLTTAAPVPVQGNVERYSRVTLTARPDGTVLQRGEVSADRAEWTTVYAFIYRRRAD